jgi:hypothetical protein
VTTRAALGRRAVAGACAIAIAAVAAFACNSTSTATAYTPYQGVDVPSSLITRGVGCGVDAGIAYFAAVLAPKQGADGGIEAGEDGGAEGGCGSLPDPANVVAGSFVACFTPSAVFQLGTSGPLDVWLFGYSGGTPPNVSCTDPTCPLPSGSIATLLADQGSVATRATRTLRCLVDPELSQHPEAFGCIECPAGSADASAPEADASAPDADASAPEADATSDAASAAETGPGADASLDAGAAPDAAESGPGDAAGD